DFPVIEPGTDLAEARRRFAATDESWMIVLDDERRPQRWAGEHQLADGGPGLFGGPPVVAKVLPNATLHDALEQLLMSNAGFAVVVDEKDRFQGVVDVSSLADVLKRMRADAKKHYDTLAEHQPPEPESDPA